MTTPCMPSRMHLNARSMGLVCNCKILQVGRIFFLPFLAQMVSPDMYKVQCQSAKNVLDSFSLIEK